jgi:6,7-dimethyl-8-ribityllumazine synthase
MAGPAPHREQTGAPPPQAQPVRVLLIEAPYYPAISDLLAQGALAELTAAGAQFERVTVPGALEIPLALSQAVESGLVPAYARNARFDGCVALGCVIRGDTTHYDTVCDNANHWLMDLAVRHAIPLGNGILTVEDEAQAAARAGGGRQGKGGGAVRACLALVALARAFAPARRGARP